MTLCDYQRTEWLENYDYRAIDADGNLFYHKNAPKFIDGYWVSVDFCYAGRYDDCWARVNCKHSMQSRDQHKLAM